MKYFPPASALAICTFIRVVNMPRYSILIPQRNSATAVRERIDALLPVLKKLEGDTELIIIDDGSTESDCVQLQSLCQDIPSLRLLRCPVSQGASIATAIGLQAARGEIILAIDPAGKFEPVELLNLTAQLARADAVFSKRPRQGMSKLWQRVIRIPRWLLLGLDVRDPGARCWAARREAVAGIEPAKGLLRSLAHLISIRGFRVCEIPFDYQPGGLTLSDGWPNPGDLVSLWWRKRRHVLPLVQEVPLGRKELRILPNSHSTDLRRSA